MDGCRRYIYMTGYAGEAGAVRLAREHREELLTRYSRSYVDRMCGEAHSCGEEVDRRGEDFLSEDIHSRVGDFLSEDIYGEESDIHSASHLRIKVGRSGLYEALWNLCEEYGCGSEIRLQDIPMRQETIEVCNFLDVDPFEIDSSGCELMVYDLNECARIGHLTTEKRRVIIYREHVRYLRKPEITRVPD